MTETILQNDLPHFSEALYEHKFMVNTMRSELKEVSPDTTEYTSAIEYTKFNGWLPKLMTFFMPGVFRKQVQKWLDQFKEFAESHQKS